MPVALHDQVAAVHLTCARARSELHFLCTEAHRGALLRALIARLCAMHLVLPFGNERDHRMGGGTVELGAVGVGEPEHVAAIFDDRHLHAETDPEVGHCMLARVAHGLDLALDTPFAEAAGHEDRVHVL